MLDKTSLRFLRDLQNQPNKTLSWPVGGFPEEYGERREFIAMLDFLERNEYITIRKDSDGNRVGAFLAHKGFKYKEFHKMRRNKELAEWVRYIITIVIAISALIVSVISLALQFG